MKKMYAILFVLTILIGGVNAQKVKKEVLKQSKSATFTAVYSDNSSSMNTKGAKSTLNENFDIIAFPPASWSVDVADVWYNSGDAAVSGFEAAGDPVGHFAFFGAAELDDLTEGSLITPVLHPTAGSNTLNYNVNLYQYYTMTWVGAGAALYIEFSTNGGTTWTTSTTNTLATLTGYNVEGGTGWLAQSVDLSAYNGGTVQVRFRAVADYGAFELGIDDVTGPEADVTLSATDLVVTASAQNAMTPLLHATYALGANVANSGADLAAAATLNITATPGAYSDAITIALPFAYGDDSTYTSAVYYTAAATGNVTVTYAAPLTGDPNPGDNTATQTFAVSDTVFATDNGIITGGVGSNSAALTLGNMYFLLAEDQATSITIGFGTVTTDLAFTASIYSINTTTYAATLVYTTPSYTRTAAMSLVNTTFGFPAQTLPAGLYLVAVNQLDATNIALGYTGEAGGMIYSWDATNGLGATGNFGNAVVRLNVGTPVNADMTAANANVTVYPNPANDVIFVSETANITVVNMIGQVVATANNATQVNVSELPAGNYIVKVQNDNVNSVQKINIVK